MSRSEIKVGIRTESSDYIEVDFSSGDSNKMKPKQLYREENNNEVDELSKDFTEMGCIVDAVKRPPNICVETCVYEDSDSGNDKSEVETHGNDEDVYSDEFEEDKSEIEEVVKEQSKSEHNIKETASTRPLVKLSKSLSNSSTNKQPSLSGQSTNYGSISIPPTRRVNMSFTNERLREIERHNHILLNKILSARNSRKSAIPPREPARKPVPPAAVHRKMQQKKIDHDNMILLKKIQRAKSSACSLRR